ncbi:MAG TPA: ferredoxin [Candidatus Limnocylindria bacterium]
MSVDPELCIGSAECVRLVPSAFRIDEELGVSIPLPGAASADRALLLRARDNCPTHAIAVADENGDRVPDEAGSR